MNKYLLPKIQSYKGSVLKLNASEFFFKPRIFLYDPNLHRALYCHRDLLDMVQYKSKIIMRNLRDSVKQK